MLMFILRHLGMTKLIPQYQSIYWHREEADEKPRALLIATLRLIIGV